MIRHQLVGFLTRYMLNLKFLEHKGLFLYLRQVGEPLLCCESCTPLSLNLWQVGNRI